MRILLVRPAPDSETIGLQHVMVVEPLELEILAALVRENDEVFLADLIIEKKPFEYFVQAIKPDIVGFTGYITNVTTIVNYCIEAKTINPDIISVIGGVHCEVCPEDFDTPAVDYRVVRNATRAFPQLLDYIENRSGFPEGVLKSNETNKPDNLPDWDFYMPLPNRNLTQKHRSKYFYIFQNKVALIKTSFGCPYTCSFCFCRSITNGKYVRRPLPDVINELNKIREKEVYIVDDDFLVDEKVLSEFILLVKESGIRKKYLIYGRADFIARNKALIADFKSIGLSTIIVGFESFREDELDAFQKHLNIDDNHKAMAILNELKIDCFATLILSPDWGRAEFDQLIKQVRKLGIHFVNLQPLTPLPKTGLLIDDNELLIPRSDFSKWDLAHVMIRPTKVSVAQYYREIQRAYNKIVFNPRIMHKYPFAYNLKMLIKMVQGSRKVSAQYRMKIKEAEQHA